MHVSDWVSDGGGTLFATIGALVLFVGLGIWGCCSKPERPRE